MNRIAIKKLAAVTTLALISVVVVAVIVVSQLPKSGEIKFDSTLAPGKYEGYSIRCHDTGMSVKESRKFGPVTHTYEQFVFRCTATAPGESSPHKLNLEIAQAASIYVWWTSCDDSELLLKGNFIVDDSQYDRVLEESLDCVRAISEST